MDQNIRFVARPLESMIKTRGSNSDWSQKQVIHWENIHSKNYWKRVAVERFFAYLKEDFNMDVQGQIRIHTIKAHVYSALWLMALKGRGWLPTLAMPTLFKYKKI